VSGHTQLPHKKDVEWDLKLAGNLKTDRHPATRQRKYQDVVASRVSSKFKGQKPSSFDTIMKIRWHVIYSLPPGIGRYFIFEIPTC
jgi:hypothetical protein